MSKTTIESDAPETTQPAAAATAEPAPEAPSPEALGDAGPEAFHDRIRTIDKIEREIRLTGDLTDEQRTRLLEIANRCPVHRTLHAEVWEVSTLV